MLNSHRIKYYGGFGLATMLLVSTQLAFANDGIGEVKAGGIVFGKTESIAMKKEVLNVGWKEIAVDYDFLNESNESKSETIFFPLPEYSANMGYEDNYYGEPENFVIQVDGKNVNYHTIVQALYKNKNVTEKLRQIGLKDEEIATYSNFPSSSPFNLPKNQRQLSANQIKELKKADLLNNDNSDGSLSPAWSVVITYQWQQTFPAGQMVHVHHQYKPFVATGPAYYGIEKETIAQYCMDKDFLNSWHKKSDKYSPDNDNRYSMLPAAGVGYILETGNTWKNGIEDFTLNIHKSDKQELVSLCFPGEFKKTDEKTLSVHLQNFHPAQNLDVYFSNINQDSMEEKTVAPKIKP
jgi:hypothetical protein